jgi:DNA-binding beta-propeller fold protein YncE
MKIRELFLAGTAALAVAAPAAAQSRPLRGTLVVTNKAAATASLIDLATGRVVAELPTGDGPHEVVTSRDGRVAVVTDYGAQVGGSSLTIIDVPGKRVARTVDLGSYTRPHGIAFMPGDSVVAVTSEATQNVVFVRVTDGRVLRAIATGQNGSHMLAITASGDRIFTGNIGSGSVSELNVAGGTTTRSMPVPAQPEPLTVTPSGDEVWVGSNSRGLVSVLKTADGTVETAASGFGWAYRILITPDMRHVLIPDLRGESLRVLDYRTRAERARLAFPGGGPQGIALSGDGGTAFLSMSTQDRVAIIDLASMTVTGYVPAGSRPDGVAWSSVELR